MPPVGLPASDVISRTIPGSDLMKLGLIADIHEHVEYLQVALQHLHSLQVDRIIGIGDIVAQVERLDETCRLLAEAGVEGVWGNHDFGLCGSVSDELRHRYSPTIINYMATLHPRLVIDGCQFMHVEPWLDPENIADLWYFEGPLSIHGNVSRIFDAAPFRHMFAGHYHQWLLAKPSGVCQWTADAPTCLHDDRYFVVVGALCEGQFATFDTETHLLTPFHIPYL
jgi:Calcineurin-like phosphoesterase superfamily domain